MEVARTVKVIDYININAESRAMIEKLVDHNANPKSWTAEDAAEHFIENDCDDCKKGLMIGLDESEGGYCIHWVNAGLTLSEIVALLETTKQMFVEELLRSD